MSEPYVGELKIFPYNFIPRGWAACEGQLLSRTQNASLFAILGTTYGGGPTTFALPDFRGRVGVGTGQGPGTLHTLGEVGGTADVTLTTAQLAAHTHPLQASAGRGDLAAPGPARALARSSGGNAYGTTAGTTVPLGNALAPEGGGQSHPNRQPYLAVQIAIAIDGVFPSMP